MIIWPNCSLKTLKECESGAIVRQVGYNATGAFAIVCDVKNSDSRALIFLEKGGPEFQVVANLEEIRLLEYTAESILQVDQAGPFEASPNNMYQANGCLLRGANGWRLNVRYSTGLRHEGAQYDFSTKTLEHISDDLLIGTFGKWRLFLVNPDHVDNLSVEVGSFTWKARGEETS